MTIYMLERVVRDRDNRDTWELDGDHGYFTDEAVAQRKADELNRPRLAFVHQSSRSHQQKALQSVREHNALIDAGLRTGKRREEPLAVEEDFDAWLSDRSVGKILEDYFIVTDIEAAEQSDTTAKAAGT